MPSVYQIIQDKFVKSIEEAIKNGDKLAWQKPWVGGQPVNYVTRKPYRGVNLFLLPQGGEYITFKQLQKLQEKKPELKIKKGCHKHMIVFWNMLKKEENGEEKTIPLLRYYNVFHISDIEGLESKIANYKHNDLEGAEKVIKDYVDRSGLNYKVVKGSDRAYYSPSIDSLVTPDKSQFKEIAEYYSTNFHELVHSTGHPDRLKRFNMAEKIIFGNDSYSKEELVAEMGSAMLMGSLGIETQSSEKNSLAYLTGWLSAIKNDVHFVVQASAKAQKACDYIMGVEYKETEQSEDEVSATKQN